MFMTMILLKIMPRSKNWQTEAPNSEKASLACSFHAESFNIVLSYYTSASF